MHIISKKSRDVGFNHLCEEIEKKRRVNDWREE